jgi:DNA-binding NtrC family response regulator
MIRPTPSKHILVIEDDQTLNVLIVRQLREFGHTAVGVGSWREVEQALVEEDPSLVILDVRLPDVDGLRMIPRLTEQCAVIVLTAFGSITQAVQAIKSGASEYLTKPVKAEELELVVNRVLENVSLHRSYQFVKTRLGLNGAMGMIGEDAGIEAVRRLIDVVGPVDTTVLIQGESGVGKELVAEAIHQSSPRSASDFVPVDCCALQENLFESELFGHERGAFTGADRRKQGLIEVAEGGTLFLDEIGEISPAIQAKLLRVIETGRFRRLGGTKDLSSDVRFVAATNRDLKAMSDEGEFRSDLYYRLTGFVITVPPLRERIDDVIDLTQHFIDTRTFSRNISKRFSPRALKMLQSYHWPGNVRELKNLVERALLISGSQQVMRRDHLGLPEGKYDHPSKVELKFDHEPSLDELRDAYLAELLEKYRGHRAQIASILGISERNIYRLINRQE